MLDDSLNESRTVEKICRMHMRERVTTLLLRKGMKQSDLAKLVERDDALISRIVNAVEVPPVVIQAKIAIALDTWSEVIWRQCECYKKVDEVQK